MRFFPAILLLCGLHFTACPSAKPGNASGADSLACPQLDQLMMELQETEEMLQSGTDWESCKTGLGNVLKLMEENVRKGNEKCHYLNQQNYPDHPRFIFVESLADRILSDTLAAGIYYIVRLRGIFSDDVSISEYFSEELAHLALASPDSYLGYLQSNPDQEIMLLYSTKWNFLDADTLISRFRRRPGSEAVVDYLEDWKMKHDAGGI